MSKLARDHRNSDLARIHVAKKQLAMSDEDYRAMLWSVARVRSSKDLDHAGRQGVLRHLEACGFKTTGRPAGRKALTPRQKLMWSLWQQLADAGAVTDRRMTALVSYVSRQTGVDRLEWLKDAQVDLVIESLKKWLERFGGAVR